MIKIYNRNTREEILDVEYKDEILNFLYKTIFGRIILKLTVSRTWFNKIMGVYYKSSLSKKKIIPFIEKYGINMKEYKMEDFQSFNDFFTRKKEIKVCKGEKFLPAIADGKLSVYKIEKDLTMKIKGSVYTIEELTNKKDMGKKFEEGTCLLYRLSVTDNHRYIFPDNGRIVFNEKIKGELHTVRPISKKYRIYTRNSREVSVLDTEVFGEIIQIEVGAISVGKIKNHKKTKFHKGEEKGYFEFGGSSIVVLLNKNIKIDTDILEKTKEGYEVQVSVGEKVGKIV